MFEKLPVPSKGDKLRASWGAGVTNRVNELGAMAPAGMLSRDGQTGIGFAPLPANLRDRRGKATSDKSCFRIESKEVNGETHRFLVDCYYNVGGVTKSADDIDIEDLIQHQQENESDDPQNVVIYFDILSSEPANVCNESELRDLQEDPGKYLFALYRLSPEGAILTDFRTAPQIQMWEDIQ